MEKIASEKKTKKDNEYALTAGYFIEVECCMCGKLATFAGEKKEDALQALINAEWRDLSSDEYALTGNYCGCEYFIDSKSVHKK